MTQTEIIKHILTCVLSDVKETIDRMRKCEYWQIAPHIKSLCLSEHALYQKAQIGGIKFYGLPTNYINYNVSQVEAEKARQRSDFQQHIIQSRSTNNAPTITLISSGSEDEDDRTARILPESSENSDENAGNDKEEADDSLDDDDGDDDDDDEVATPRLNARARRVLASPQNQQQNNTQLAQTEFASQLSGLSGVGTDIVTQTPMLTLSQSTIPSSNLSRCPSNTPDIVPMSQMEIDRLVAQHEAFTEQERSGYR